MLSAEPIGVCCRQDDEDDLAQGWEPVFLSGARSVNTKRKSRGVGIALLHLTLALRASSNNGLTNMR